MPSSRPHAFSLLELLVVVAIVGIMLAFIAPAVRGFGRSSALTSGGNLVTNLATLARQEAMSKNTLTALLLLKNQGTEADYRTFAVISYEDGAGWRQLTPWENLPSGIVVDRAGENEPNSDEGTFLKNSPLVFPSPATGGTVSRAPASYLGSPVRDFAACIFLPNGSRLNAERAAQLRIVEGFNQGSATRYTSPKSNTSPPTPANYYDVAIVGATGVTKVTRPE